MNTLFSALVSILLLSCTAAQAQDFLGLEGDIARLALGAARWLVDHDPRIVERYAHPRFTRREQEASH